MNYYLETKTEAEKPIGTRTRPAIRVLLLDGNPAEAADLCAKLADSRYVAFSVSTAIGVAQAI